ncbi:MAG TPA: ABC transporter permease [Anaerolineales bacterium]|nr:ABC transporter permease [Anaerolineales bacterium]
MKALKSRLVSVLRKETREILRDPYTLGVALVLPLVMLFLFAYGVNTDVRDIELVVLDFDRSPASRDYARAFVNSGYFRSVGFAQDYQTLGDLLDRDAADVALVIPPGFARSLSDGEAIQVQTILDGSYTPFAQVAQSYVEAINAAYNGVYAEDYVERHTGQSIDQMIALSVDSRVLYNPGLKSVNSIVPGLFGVILMAFPPLLSALAIVREKERGSIQQVFVSPIRPVELILGKLIPYGVIAFVEMVIVLAGGAFWFGVPFRGSLILFLVASALYVLCTVGIGLFVSTLTRSQVAAMLFATVLTIMPSMLFSGFIFPVHTMPAPMQTYASAFPARTFIDLARGIVLKGQGLGASLPAMGYLAAYAAGLVLISALRFKKRIG